MLTDDDGDDYDCVLLWKMADLRKHYRSNYFHCLSPTKSLAVAVNSNEWEDVSRVNVDGPDLLMAAWVSRKCTLPSSFERIDILVGMDSFNRVLGTVTELEAPTVNGEPLPLLLPPELLACSCMAWFLEFFKRFPSSRFLPRADFEEHTFVNIATIKNILYRLSIRVERTDKVKYRKTSTASGKFMRNERVLIYASNSKRKSQRKYFQKAKSQNYISENPLDLVMPSKMAHIISTCEEKQKKKRSENRNDEKHDCS
uniref:Uncharacterized protein n=1 Tax=Glossina austeni TaxID=7395 RepID=A0A1A9VCN6_GLOAU